MNEFNMEPDYKKVMIYLYKLVLIKIKAVERKNKEALSLVD